jgi:hypothetical protein
MARTNPDPTASDRFDKDQPNKYRANMPTYPNVKVCTHIKVTGVRCDSPALRGEQFCYFHQRMIRGVRTPPHSRLHPIALNRRRGAPSGLADGSHQRSGPQPHRLPPRRTHPPRPQRRHPQRPPRPLRHHLRRKWSPASQSMPTRAWTLRLQMARVRMARSEPIGEGAGLRPSRRTGRPGPRRNCLQFQASHLRASRARGKGSQVENNRH